MGEETLNIFDATPKNMDTIFTDPKKFRHEIRKGKYTKPTSGQCPGYLQAKFVIEKKNFLH
jgi:uncharacterized protein YcsI (UPF0317 family)